MVAGTAASTPWSRTRAGSRVHTRGPDGTWWRGSYLVGCDGARSTVRKLLDIRFPGRTAVERHAVAALRTELPWPGEALLHRQPPWRTGPGGEVTARPLPDGVWRLDWLLPPGERPGHARRSWWPASGTPSPAGAAARPRRTSCSTPASTPCTTGSPGAGASAGPSSPGTPRICWARSAPRGSTRGCGTPTTWPGSWPWPGTTAPPSALLDSYQAERRAAVAARLRAADQALPILRGGGGLRHVRPRVGARGHDALLTDGHLGRGPLGAPRAYAALPARASRTPRREIAGGHAARRAGRRRAGDRAEDGSFVRLRDRLGRGALLVVLVAPGTGVWERRHWVTRRGHAPAGGRGGRAAASGPSCWSPRATRARRPTPCCWSGPDGHLVAALSGVRPGRAVRGGGGDAGRARRGRADADRGAARRGDAARTRSARHTRPLRAAPRRRAST